MMRASVRVAPPLRDAHLERAAAVDGAGKDLVAGRLVDRQRLAGHRRLVDRADTPRPRSPSSGIFSPGFTMMMAPGSSASTGCSRSPGAVAKQHLRRREIHQRAHGVARPLEGLRFERLRDREEKDHGGGFGPLAECDGAGRRHQHEDVDVERLEAQRLPGLARRSRQSRGPSTRERRVDDQPGAEHVGEQTTGKRAGRSDERDRAGGVRRADRRSTIGSSCSSQARMPGVGDRRGDAAVDSFAASYFTCRRRAMTSAWNPRVLAGS